MADTQTGAAAPARPRRRHETDGRPDATPGAWVAGDGEPDEGGRARLEVRAARAAARGSKSTRVVAARTPLGRRLVDIVRSRELFVFLVRKEIKVKYKNSFLGFLWSMLNPALTLAVFFVLFTYFLPNGVPNFVIYMFSATTVWNLYVTGVMGGTSTVVSNSGIVKKVPFPREILPLASVGSAFVFFLFQSVVLIVFMFAFWHRPAWGMIWLIPLALAAVLLFSSALAVFLSAVNVYLRDTQHLVEVLLFAWFWAVPAIYAFGGVQSTIPNGVHDKLARHHLLWLYFLNPMVPIVMSFQRFFYAETGYVTSTLPTHVKQQVLAGYGSWWYVGADGAVIALAAVLFLGAMLVFGRLEGNFAEEL